MKKKNSIKNDEEKWKNELEKFIVPLEEYSAWFKLKNNE
jgi:predicted choloylglycine hydrolase